MGRVGAADEADDLVAVVVASVGAPPEEHVGQRLEERAVAVGGVAQRHAEDRPTVLAVVEGGDEGEVEGADTGEPAVTDGYAQAGLEAVPELRQGAARVTTRVVGAA